VVGGFTDSSVAKVAGLMEGDSIYGLDGKQVAFFDEYIGMIPGYAGQQMTLNFMRNGEAQSVEMTVPEDGKIGVYAMPFTHFFDVETKKYGFFEAIPAGLNKSYTVLGDYIRQFKLILNPETEAYKEVGGFLMIADQFDTQWNWQRFWSFTAFLSIMLAFLNILPIPALDGGHVVFVLWEMISGRKPSEKVLEVAQM